MKAFLVTNLIFLLGGTALIVSAQNAPITTRDADGQIVIARQSAGASLGAYLGDAGGRRGAVVGKVLADSPAAKAGLAENDLITGFGTERVENAAQIYRGLSIRKPNDSVALKVRRDTAELTLSVTLGERRVRGDDPCQKLLSETNAMLGEAQRLKSQAEEAQRKGDKKTAEELTREADAMFLQAEAYRKDVEQAIVEGRTATIGRKDGCAPPDSRPQITTLLGLEVSVLTPQLAKFFGLDAGTGLLVTDVTAGSPAAQAGFRAGDCLLSLNGKTATSGFELRRLFETASETTISANIVREGKTQTLTISRR